MKANNNRSRILCSCLAILPFAPSAHGEMFALPQNARPENALAFHPVCRHHNDRPRGTALLSRRLRASTRLRARPQDNFVAGISEIGLGFSLGVLWSEYSVISTGCGPLRFSDALERLCYQGVIILAGAALFNRIVSNGKGLEESAVDLVGPLEEFTLVQVRAAEYMSVLAVLGAFVALAFQYGRGVNMDGLSGIDVDLCRALRDL